MKSATAIIGSNFGDEGKGLLTDYVSDENSVVIRYNGGAQAGHTVVRDGKRHVFHHFSSGSLRGASTYLSRFFINNPILYFKELADLQSLDCNPFVQVDSLGLVTTPFDMFINQMVEEARGQARHGSCGVGINETIKRSEAGFRIIVDDLKNLDELHSSLEKIKKQWVPERLQALGVEPSEKWLQLMDLSGNSVTDSFISYCKEYLQAVEIAPISTKRKIVFEGAQGLLLDEDHKWFPYVTHSHTGLKNIMELGTEIGLNHINVIYATRAYATRHGAGPFPGEVPGLFYPDATNVPNAWQGSLRFGHINLDLLAETVLDDARHAILPITRNLAVTCLDQVGSELSYWSDGELKHGSWREMVGIACKSVEAATCITSFGPSASDVRILKEA